MMRRTVVVAGPDLPSLLQLSLDAGLDEQILDIVVARRPVLRLAEQPIPEADIALVLLDGLENVAEMRLMLDAHPRTRFVLLAPAFPPAAALARIAAKHGSMFLDRGESHVVVAATVVALLVHAASLPA